MSPESCAAATAAGRGSLGDDEVNGNERLDAVDLGGRYPHARLDVVIHRQEAKAGGGHRRLKLRLLAQQCGVERQIGVRRERRDGQVGLAGVEVDRLRFGDDERSAVRSASAVSASRRTRLASTYRESSCAVGSGGSG